MTSTSAPPTAAVKGPARLLILTLPVFVLFLALATITIATKVDSTSADLTPGQLSELGVGWVALHLLWVAAPVLAAIGLLGLARARSLPGTSAIRILAGVVVVLAAAYLIVQVLAFGFDGETWGDSRLYPLGVLLSLGTYWVGTLPATMMVGIGLAGQGVARATARTVVGLVALFLVFDLLTFLPVLVGSGSLAETAGLPPFLLGFFWAALGFRLLRSRVSSLA